MSNLKNVVPRKFRKKIRESAIDLERKLAHSIGLSVFPEDDYYSPLPIQVKLKENMSRWYKPSKMMGVAYDVEQMKNELRALIRDYGDEYLALRPFEENAALGFGPGSTELDTMLVYLMTRTIKPVKYIEVGCGLSTYYASLAAKKCAEEGAPFMIRAIDPFPFQKLYDVAEVNVIAKEVQDIPLRDFEALDEGDILFIDSTHIVKIDGDVPFLFLEVLPRLKKGVNIHVHDIAFPYNVPFPAELYLMEKTWPWYFTEAMLLQAFLSYNDAYKIKMSLPLIRHQDEEFLIKNVPKYIPISDYHAESRDVIRRFPPCSIWLKKEK